MARMNWDSYQKPEDLPALHKELTHNPRVNYMGQLQPILVL